MKKKGFEDKNATDCGTKAYYLLTPTVTSGDLEDHNQVV